MRQLIMNRGERFDLDSVRADIDEIVKAFDRYLDEYPVKTARSMHSLLGPVPMILDGARVRKESVPTLVGRAVRAHEMNPRTKGYLAPSALEALETASTKLLDLCNKVPVMAVTKVTERIRYSVYYVRRKKGIEWMEQTRLAFIAYLRSKYPAAAALASAWAEKDTMFDSVRFPSKKETSRNANAAKKADIEAFWELPEAERFAQEEDDNA
jgi:hypothetical protein